MEQNHRDIIPRREFIKAGLMGAAGVIIGAGSVKAAPVEKIPEKKAWFFHRLSQNRVVCRLCPHGCVIGENQWGRCRTRKNIRGNLYSMVYGRPAAIHVDPVEKKPFYHFLPGAGTLSFATTGCNLSCVFCQNHDLSQTDFNKVPHYNAPPEKLAKEAENRSIRVLTGTYTEPAVFSEYLYDVACAAKKKKIKTLMVTGAFIGKAPLNRLLDVLDGVKIDLKAFSDKFYRELTGGRLQPVLDALKTVVARKKWLEIVYLVIPRKNDNLDEIKSMCRWIVKNLGREVPLHFTRFIPMFKLKNIPPTPVSLLEKCRKTAMAEGIEFVYVGNIPGHQANNTYCPKCKKLLIMRQGLRVVQDNITGGVCSGCNRRIPGVWV